MARFLWTTTVLHASQAIMDAASQPSWSRVTSMLLSEPSTLWLCERLCMRYTAPRMLLVTIGRGYTVQFHALVRCGG